MTDSANRNTVWDWLLRRYPSAKRQTLRRMIQAGRVRVDAKVVRNARTTIAPESRIELTDRPTLTARPGRRGKTPLDIVYEDEDLLVVHKPAGLLTSTTPREPRPTLLEQVRQYLSVTYPRARVGLIHRLDRDASGILVFSKNPAAYRSLKAQFFRHTVTRVYAAVVDGIPTPDRGQIRSRLIERADGAVHSTNVQGRGQLAITLYETVRSAKRLSLLRVTLHTGRKHQIRVHLSERGHPVVGDGLYGDKSKSASRLMLAAVQLQINHPRTGELMKFERPLPEDFPLRWNDRGEAPPGPTSPAAT